jgi:hypothetical protein
MQLTTDLLLTEDRFAALASQVPELKQQKFITVGLAATLKCNNSTFQRRRRATHTTL